MKKKLLLLLISAVICVILVVAYYKFDTSENIKDTKAVHGLIFLNSFAKDYTSQLKDWCDYIEKTEPSLKSAAGLKEYYNYLSNNNAIIENKIGLLMNLYNEGITDLSSGNQERFKDLKEYLYRFFMTNSAVHNIIPELEDKIADSSNIEDNEIRMLESIHDQILFKNLQAALIEGNISSVKDVLAAKIYNAENISFEFMTGSKTFTVSKKKNNVLKPEIILGTIINNNLGKDLENELVNNPINSPAINNILSAKNTETSMDKICNVIYSNIKLYYSIILGINFNEDKRTHKYLTGTMGANPNAGQNVNSGCNKCHN